MVYTDKIKCNTIIVLNVLSIVLSKITLRNNGLKHPLIGLHFLDTIKRYTAIAFISFILLQTSNVQIKIQYKNRRNWVNWGKSQYPLYTYMTADFLGLVQGLQ